MQQSTKQTIRLVVRVILSITILAVFICKQVPSYRDDSVEYYTGKCIECRKEYSDTVYFSQSSRKEICYLVFYMDNGLRYRIDMLIMDTEKNPEVFSGEFLKVGYYKKPTDVENRPLSLVHVQKGDTVYMDFMSFKRGIMGADIGLIAIYVLLPFPFILAQIWRTQEVHKITKERKIKEEKRKRRKDMREQKRLERQ